MAIEQINPTIAKDKLEANDKIIYLDVRTTQEYEEGHAPGAHNIPIMKRHTASNQMTPNSKFEAEVSERFAPDTILVIGCKMGGRSQKACDFLEAAGFTNLFNIQGGFEGSSVEPGWNQLGFPVEQGQPAGQAYKK